MTVSIIIPVYNVEKYIESCLASVFNQTYKDLEIILVDDCGSDKSMEITEKVIFPYKDKFNIRVIHHDKNKGLSAARNTGIANATGKYIYFLDSDDSLPPNSISLLTEQLTKYPNADFIIGGIQTTGYKKYTYPLLSQEYLNGNKQILADYLLFKWNVMACNKLIKKDFIEKNNILFLEGVYHEDMDFSFKLALFAQSMACCKEITYSYLIREESITTFKKPQNYTDYFFIFSNNFKKLTTPNFPYDFHELISDYITENLYFLSLDLINEKSRLISKEFKQTLLKEIKRTSKDYLNLKNSNFKYTVKKHFLSLPICLQVLISKLYITLINIQLNKR